MDQTKQGQPLFDQADMAGDLTSYALDITGVTHLAVQLDSPANTHAGTVYYDLSLTGRTWVEQSTSVAVLAGAPLAAMLELPNCCAAYLRLRYIRASGQGKLTALAHLKRCR